MRIKEKLLKKIVICAVIFTVVSAGDFIKGPWIDKVKSAIKEQVEKNYTLEDLTEKGRQAVETIVKIPSVMTETIEKANNGDKIVLPMDENSREEIKQVYAVDGGVVYSVGIDKEKRYFVTIKHQSSYTEYRNMASVTVVPKERIRKGQSIGTYDSRCGAKFEFKKNEKTNL